MLKFCSLYSGSSGNSLYIENDDTKILIDAGLVVKNCGCTSLIKC